MPRGLGHPPQPAAGSAAQAHGGRTAPPHSGADVRVQPDPYHPCHPSPQLIPDLFARPPPLRLQGFVYRSLGWLWPLFTVSDGDFVQTAGLDALVSSGWPAGGGSAPLRRRCRRRAPSPPPCACSCFPALQILTRFLVLGLQVFLPSAVLCCAISAWGGAAGGRGAAGELLGGCSPLTAAASPTAAVLPLATTGTFLEDNQADAATTAIMQLTISNIQPGSNKLW